VAIPALAGETGETVVDTTVLNALLAYVNLIAGRVPEGQRLAMLVPASDDDIDAIFTSSMTDEDMTHRLNEILSEQDTVAGQPDLPVYEGDDL
jgi:hypothetical protein